MSMEVAEEIRKQIGQKAFFMMGAKALGGAADSLTFKVGRGARGKAGAVTHVRVTLEPSDTYTVKTMYVRGTSVKDRESVEGVYCDTLRAAIEGVTGFYLSMGTMGEA